MAIFRFDSLSFRFKLLLLPAVAAVGFLLTLLVTVVSGSRSAEKQLLVETGHGPSLEMSRNLEQTLAQIQRSLLDGVAAENADFTTDLAPLKVEFEKTLADDDWTRLRPFFADDAVYEVKGPMIGCRLQGPDAIFAGMKKSLDGFDRKFEGRDPELTSAPEVQGDEFRIAWKVTYKKEGLPPFILVGQSIARYRDGVIAYLSDVYDTSVEGEFAAWQSKSGVKLDPSYI